VVVRIAVDLDGQPIPGPAAVDEPAADRAVGLRQRQVGLAQSLEEPFLEFLSMTGVSP
jgi:hypothetical protein